MKLEPLHDLQVINYIEWIPFGIDLSISNSVLWMWLATAFAFLFFRIAFHNPSIVPGRIQLLAEIVFLFIRDLVEKNIAKDGLRYFPLLFTLFLFILFNNLVGLLPGSFTPTSQIIVTGCLALSVFLYTVVLRIRMHGWGFFLAFAPAGLSVWLLPLMVPIEVISFLARPTSLALRLFANMTAGHTVLAVLAFLGLVAPWFLRWIPMGFTVIIMALEIFIAFIQAYIFTILTCVYIDDAVAYHG
jgi:F-type H+-transporting ATPase subunit a